MRLQNENYRELLDQMKGNSWQKSTLSYKQDGHCI